MADKVNPQVPKGELAEKSKRTVKEDRPWSRLKTVGDRYKKTPLLGRLLEEAGLLNQEMLKDFLARGDESAQTLKESLLQQGLVREEDILDAIAAGMSMEKVDLKEVDISPELLGQIDQKIARRYQVFPVAYDDETLKVALVDPLNIQVLDDLERIVGKRVTGCVAPEDDIKRAIRHYYEQDEISELYKAVAEKEEDSFKPFSKYEEVDLTHEAKEDEPAVVKFLDLVFKQAIHDRASDIHVEPQRYGITIRFRIDGILHEVPSPPKKWQSSIASRIKVLAGLDLAEKRVPQDGRIMINVGDRKLDFRVSTMPSMFGEGVQMRILDQTRFMLSLEEVGFTPENVKLFRNMIKIPSGVILMTGPSGCGKTTTLYAALRHLNDIDTKIVTIEDPVEYQIEGICQLQVNDEIGLNFGRALRSVLRQSPDIILVGEIRDFETAEIAIRAALTGHLVFSTLHTNDAPSATIRLLNMGMKPFMIASSVYAVVSQRLLRRICPYCKNAYTPSEQELRSFNVSVEQYGGKEFYQGRGCERCNGTGYRGRTAIHEIFVMSPKVRQLVIRTEPLRKIRATARKEGMRVLREDGLQKALLGITTIEEVNRVTKADEA